METRSHTSTEILRPKPGLRMTAHENSSISRACTLHDVKREPNQQLTIHHNFTGLPKARCYVVSALSKSVTSSVMETNSKLVRLFAVLRTIADLGPVATADHEFSDTARQLLERIMRAFESDQAALLL